METWSFAAGRWQKGNLEGAEAYWHDIANVADPGLDELARRYKLHPLAVEDCRSPELHAPKVDEFPSHLFIVLQAFVDEGEGPEPKELDVFLGHDFLITFQDEPLPPTAAVAALLASGIGLRPGVDGVFHAIADNLVDEMLPMIHTMAAQLDAIEDDIVERPDRANHQRQILTIRAIAGRMRRLMVPELNVIQRLSRGEFGYVCEPNRIYFRDVFDHLMRIDLGLEGLREDTEVALNTYLSAINNEMNQVMKVLSVVGALFLPASVIAGIFGTNFRNVPGLQSNEGFFIMIGAMLAVAGGMALYFHRKGWF